MIKRFSFILLVLIVPFLLQETKAQKPSIYKVSRLSFNSDFFSEISPVIFKDGILYCSNKRYSAVTDRTGFDGRRLYNIYFAEKKDSSDWIKPQDIHSERSSRFNNGPLCIAPDGTTVYFTSEVETGAPANKRTFVNHSGIFMAKLSGTELSSLTPFKYNSTTYDVGQPSISSDGKFLFFASDMPGGQGKSDLYFCEYVNGEWSAPVNLGSKVNSPGAENFPSMHSSGRLYFASDRPGGVGKLDVYFTSLYNGKWDDPSLLSEPINSTADDFAFAGAENLQTGYFASNRSNSDDIFRFTSTIIRKSVCDTLVEDNYCFRFMEENAMKYDTMPFRYEWKFGDGNKAVGPSVDHCFNGPGTYIVQLDVVNLITKETYYNEKSDTLVLKSVEQAYISSADRVTEGEAVMLNADSTNLPGWKIAQYYWNFGDETIDVGKEVVKKYLRPGTYNIQLIVTTETEQGGTVREACVSKNIIVIRHP